MTRTYIVHATRNHYRVSMVWPPEVWCSSARIRQFTIVVFRKIFGGLEPDFHWHIDGQMAAASDKRGNEVTVDQENHWHQFRAGTGNRSRQGTNQSKCEGCATSHLGRSESQ